MQVSLLKQFSKTGDMDDDVVGKEKIKEAVVMWIRRIYVIAFNLYAWFWLGRLLYFYKTSSWEDYLLWFFATAGMYFFVLDGVDVFLKKINKSK